MYRCELCGKVTAPGTPCARVVTERRNKVYPRREKTMCAIDRSQGRPKVIWKDDPGGAGWEIVRERLACPQCAERRLGESAAEVAIRAAGR